VCGGVCVGVCVCECVIYSERKRRRRTAVEIYDRHCPLVNYRNALNVQLPIFFSTPLLQCRPQTAPCSYHSSTGAVCTHVYYIAFSYAGVQHRRPYCGKRVQTRRRYITHQYCVQHGRSVGDGNDCNALQ